MTKMKMRRKVDEQKITMTDWRVFDLMDGHRHIVGFDVEHGARRVSSVVQAFDSLTLEALVETGYRYVLKGGPGPDEHQDCEHTWVRWTLVHACRDWSDQTEKRWHEHSEVHASSLGCG